LIDGTVRKTVWRSVAKRTKINSQTRQASCIFNVQVQLVAWHSRVQFLRPQFGRFPGFSNKKWRCC
jgi:hypothetical protein